MPPAGEPSTPADPAVDGTPEAPADAAGRGTQAPAETDDAPTEGAQAAPQPHEVAETGDGSGESPVEGVHDGAPAVTAEEGQATPTSEGEEPGVDAPGTPGAGAAEDPDDDTPYVPLVFAFDPDVSAVVRSADEGADPERPVAGSTGPEEAGDAPASAAEPSPSVEPTAPAEPTAPDEPTPTAPAPAAASAVGVSETEPGVAVPVVGSGTSTEAQPETAEPGLRETVPAAPAPAAAASAESAPADPGPAETAPTDIAPAETAPAGTAPTETAPTETAPTDIAPAETAPAETVPAEEAAAGEVAPTDAAPSDTEVLDRVVAPVAAVPVAAVPAAAPERTEVIPAVAPWERPAPVRVSARSAATPAASHAAPAEPVAATAVGAFPPVPPDEERVTSPFDGFDEDGPRRGWVRGLMWTGIGVLVLGGLYTGAQWYFSDKVPSGTTVAGVDVGGKTRTAAQDELEAALGPRAAEPVTLVAGDATTTLDPAASGLAFDAEATAEELTAFSMNPVRLWEHLVGGEAKPPVVTVDEAALDAQVEALRGGLDVAPVDGTVQFVDGAPTATPATDGASVVMDSAVDAIATGWLVTDGPIELATEPVAPEITQEETDAALAEAQKVVSAPVVVTVGDQSPELPAETLAATASYAAADGALALTFDGTALVQAVVDRTNDLLTVPDDAHFVFSNGVPVIEGGAPGTTIDPAAIATAVTTAATGDDRTAPVELVESDPAQSVAALEALGVKEKVSEFSTPLTSEPVRTENLRVGASKVNGTLVLPGETFSLTEALSPITAAGGYRSAGIVQDGKHIEGVGGGLSQMATTTYNAGFFAGLEDVEHRQHSYWFTRYPAGREATIFVGSLDMRFKNDTPYGVLMQSWVGGGELHVAIWSTKHFEVETTASQKSNVVQPTTVTHTGADCVPQAAGNPGFSITNYRKVYLDGELVKDEADRWTYKPDNQVVCAP